MYKAGKEMQGVPLRCWNFRKEAEGREAASQRGGQPAGDSWEPGTAWSAMASRHLPGHSLASLAEALDVDPFGKDPLEAP